MLSETSWIIHTPNALSYTEEEFRELAEAQPETLDKISMFGKQIDLPRYQKLYGERDYTYSGIKLQAQKEDIPRLVQACIAYTKHASPEFNWEGALVNWYSLPGHSIGKHSDDERDLNPGAPIYSFSFGRTRRFILKPKKNTRQKTSPVQINCRSGSLIVMGGDTQKEFTHEVPKLSAKEQKQFDPKKDLRINITVRSFRKRETV